MLAHEDIVELFYKVADKKGQNNQKEKEAEYYGKLQKRFNENLFLSNLLIAVK